MPYGKGTYGSMRGRPSAAKKAAMKKKMSPAMKSKMMKKKKATGPKVMNNKYKVGR
tara:strand:+ start:1041 stop:1208 length:168 start_codon:yes stop_codon:yes gene_type:complete